MHCAARRSLTRDSPPTWRTPDQPDPGACPAGPGGARRRLKIDEYGAITLQQAREIAEDWRGMVAAGRDPQLEKRDRVRRATTLDQVTQLYLEDLRERAESGAKRSGQPMASQ